MHASASTLALYTGATSRARTGEASPQVARQDGRRPRRGPSILEMRGEAVKPGVGAGKVPESRAVAPTLLPASVPSPPGPSRRKTASNIVFSVQTMFERLKHCFFDPKSVLAVSNIVSRSQTLFESLDFCSSPQNSVGVPDPLIQGLGLRSKGSEGPIRRRTPL